MAALLETRPTTTLTIDARGSFCPGPLMELIRAIRDAQVDDVITILSTDKGSRTDIPLWVRKAGHELVGVTSIGDFDEIVVRKAR